MPTTSSSAVVQDALLGMAWSLWAELGMSGWERRHAAWEVDPEALIVLTAALGDTDARLRDESLDWCIRNARYVSAVRLRRMLRDEDPAVRAAFGPYAATVRAHAPVNWPSDGAPWPYRPTGKSRPADLGRPALIALRTRALFGTGARAEIVRAFVRTPDRTHAAADLAEVAGYTKRNVEHELHALRAAGLLASTTVRGQIRYSLARADAVLAFVGARPEWSPRWGPIVRVLLAGLRLLTTADDPDPRVRAVEARRLVRALEPDLTRSGLVPPLGVEGLDAWNALDRWLVGTASALAAGDPSALL